jgi:DEAD/DEAH box helicase domain-containing protein
VSGYKKIRYYTHENIGYGPVNLPDQELHTTAAWWQLPQAALEREFASRQQALDGFLGAAYALHIVATVAVMAEARDLQKAVGSGDGAWFAQADGGGRGQLRGADGALVRTDALSLFTPTVFLYDNFPGGDGQSEPLWRRQAELLARAGELLERCDCRAGCPACVGPVLATDEDKQGDTPKLLARRVLGLLSKP